METAQAVLKKYGVTEPCVQIELVHKGGNKVAH
jgi:hypothetical protein